MQNFIQTADTCKPDNIIHLRHDSYNLLYVSANSLHCAHELLVQNSFEPSHALWMLHAFSSTHTTPPPASSTVKMKQIRQ